MRDSDSEPKIIGFLCNWCSYAGADLCGVSRFQYPPNIRIVRVMCSTRVEPAHIIEVLRAGADGVLIGGCHLGDCHYISGNYHTLNKFFITRKLVEEAGLEPDRVRLEWVSASEGERFSEVVTEFTGRIKELGPSPVRGDEGLKASLRAAVDAAKGQRLNTLAGRTYMLVEEGNVYGETIPREQMEDLMARAVREEFRKHRILRTVLTEPKSVKQMAEELGEPAHEVLESVIALRQENRMGDAGHEGFSPLYIALTAGGD